MFFHIDSSVLKKNICYYIDLNFYAFLTNTDSLFIKISGTYKQTGLHRNLTEKKSRCLLREERGRSEVESPVDIVRTGSWKEII